MHVRKLTGYLHNVVDQFLFVRGYLFELRQTHEELQQHVILIIHVLQLRITRRLQTDNPTRKMWECDEYQYSYFVQTDKSHWYVLVLCLKHTRTKRKEMPWSIIPHLRQFWKCIWDFRHLVYVSIQTWLHKKNIIYCMCYCGLNYGCSCFTLLNALDLQKRKCVCACYCMLCVHQTGYMDLLSDEKYAPLLNVASYIAID